ncbi:MAG: hypothetical protein PHP97_00510 [Candidatus Shapirobacteria bacterium]|nr:hypothetical protein [Candidatus Shapirobacteria bacterium]MDD4383443.1 hypothetical protein [Candidatus Shapirobacteria bacterium]
MFNPIFVQFFFIIFINIVHPIYAEETIPSIEPTITPEPTVEIIPNISPIPTIIQSTTPTTTETPTTSPFLETDKSDYSPTETAIISGHNFLLNTKYFLNIVSDNLNITQSITTNESGSFIYNYELDGIYRPNYKVEIKDLDNKIISTITFTDRRDVVSATVNGISSINVFPKESITVTVGVNTDWWWFWNNDWRSTSWRFGNSGNWNCVDTPDHLKSGDYFESFKIDSPSAIGKYQLQIRIYGLKNCNFLLKSDIFTLKNAITVLTPDTTSPIITINPYDINPTNQNIIVTASTNEGVLNATSHTFTENGSFTFIATDDAGNVANQTVNINNIDKNPPSTPSLVSPLDGVSLKGDSIINDWSEISDANKYFYESYSDQETSQLKCSQTILAPNHSNVINNALDNTLWWRVKAVDNAENESLWSELRKLTIDNTNPIINISINPTNSNGQNNWYWTQPEIIATVFDINSATLKYQWDIQSGEWFDYTSSIKPNSEGFHTIYFKAQDSAGNITNYSREIKWDQTNPYLAPQNVVADPNPTSGNISKIKWEFAKDNIDIDKYEIQWILNDNNKQLFYSKTVGANTTEVNINNLIKGRWTVKVVAFDFSGRAKDSAIDLYVADSISPTQTPTPSPTFKFNKIISVVTPKITPNQPIPDPSPEVKGINSVKTSNSKAWRLVLSLGLFVLYFGGRKLFIKK